MPLSARKALLVKLRRGDPCGRPPIAPLAKNLVIAKPVRTPAVAIRTPVLSAPLPKGDWHGEAVTGGFLSPRTSCNPFVGAGFYPARSSAPLVRDAGRCGHRLAHRTTCNVSLRSQCAHWLWQSVPPSPRPPCLKGAVRRGGVLPRRNFPAAPHCKSPAKGVYCPHQHQAE